jgi:tetratricopeptide (TPR) repeat protein
MDNDTSSKLQGILQQIQGGKVVLFLGAGASCAAGGPTAEEFSKMIKEKFPKINQSLNDFIEVCQDVIDTPPYSRIDLEEFIKIKLDSLQPTRAHKIMTKYDWAAIFTTNFDDLIEVAYRVSTEQQHKACQPIYSENFQVNPSDRSRVYLFKIMGSIKVAESESGHMVLSRADYNRALTRRREYLKLLSDFVKTGRLLFIGYSFADRLVLDVIDDLKEMYGEDRLPWSYALFNSLQMDEKKQYIFSTRRIIPLECSFETFFEFLDTNYKYPVVKSISENAHLKIKGYTLEISDTEVRQSAEYFEILTEEKINLHPGEKDKFFMGANKSWGAFREDWDFKRDLYISSEFKRKIGERALCLKDRVFNELKKHDTNENKVILLKGMAGVGKTTTLRRLAYDVYKSGEAPVIIINTARVTFDYKLIASFIENLNYQLNEKTSQSEYVLPIKPVIIIDDAGSLIRHVNRLKDFLTSRGRPVVIIAAERTGEWNLMWEKFPFQIPEGNIYELSEQLTDDEKVKIIDHLYNQGYIQTKGVFWDDIIDKDFENSYFATIYTLVHPSKKPLNEIIRDQYQNLTDFTQKAFQYICSFHQFDLPINLELMVRSLKCTYEDYSSDVVGKDGAKVIFEEQDETGNLLYRTHHPIIAKKTMDFFFDDPEMQKNVFLKILKEANLSNRKEREICEKLLVEHIGPNAKPQIFTYEQQRQIFKTICEKNNSRSLIHHWGILEADNYNYPEAERLLRKALEMQRDDVESYRGESDQYILTSLGSLYSHMGIDFIRQGKIKEAEECFKKAEESFQGAKYGEFPNVYAYHSHGLMWFLRGKEVNNKIEKMDFYATALEITSIAKDNVNMEDLEQIYGLETQIWSQIGDETKITESLEVLRDKFNSARGYYLNAEFLWREAQKKKEVEERKRASELALEKVREGLKYFPNDEYCLRLQSKLLKEIFPEDLETYYKSLNKWKAVISIPNAWLLYELGRTAFILGYYDYSKNYFEELETGVGMGHKLRSRPRNPILDKKGTKKEFQGTVVDILSSYEGYIRCDTLRNLRYNIAFRPIACNFTPSREDLVKFNIEFSYRGPRAEDVRKI